MSSDQGAQVQSFDSLVSAANSLDSASYAVDGIVPKCAVRPSSVDELREIVRAASADQLAIVPWGGGSQMGFGNIPARYSAAIDLTALDDVLRYEPDDMTMSVQAGCRLAALNAMLGENRQVLPVDAAQPDRATIGGMIAVGASGPRRMGYGPLRDLIIGMTVLMPDGSIAKGGGQVVKNVTGYDMMRLHHGALGTLGIILSVNLKVIPKPPSERTVLARFSDSSRADHAARAVVDSQLGATSVVLLNAPSALEIDATSEHGWLLAVRCEAPPSAVVRQAERVIALFDHDAEDVRVEDDTDSSADIWLRVCRALDQRPDSDDVAWRLGCPASRMGKVLGSSDAELDPASGEARLTFDYGSGLAYARVAREQMTIDDQVRLTETFASLGDHASVLTGPAALKEHVDVFGSTQSGFSAVQALKERFDPNNLLNHGRFMGRL